MRIAIPAQLSKYIRFRDREIIFKKELPDNLKTDFETSKAMFKFDDENGTKGLNDKENGGLY